MKKTGLFISLFIIASSCQNQVDSSFKSAPVSNHYNLQYNHIELDSILLDSINTSSFGESCISTEGNIVFVDKNFCTVSLFDTEGRIKHTYLGYGGGPTETQIGRIAAQTMLPNGELLLLGYNLDVHLFKFKKSHSPNEQDAYSLDKIFMINRESDSDKTATSLTYTNQYKDMVCRNHGDYFYMNIYSEHPDFNILTHMEEYLTKCRHIWEVNFKTGEEGRLLASGYPQSYWNDTHSKIIFIGSCFDIDKQGNFYVNYEADSLIYVYNNNYTPLQTYGYQGQEMNTAYLPIHDYQACRANYRQERNTKGYYYWIEYVDETEILFRSYRKEGDNQDGLQIYKDGTLVADVTVPENFRVMGYIAPYYYSHIIPNLEEEDNSLWMYRFKL